VVLHVSDTLFDSWALTSIVDELPGRPPVEAWLHGITEDQPQTSVAWRDELDTLDADMFELYAPSQMLEAFPLKAIELLSDRTDRVFSHLQRIAERCPKKPIWIIDPKGTVEPNT